MAKIPASVAARRQPVRPKHVPQRTCVGCREIKAKRDLIRIVRLATGAVEVDLTGKKRGRGAYLCKTRDCWEMELKRNRLQRALKTAISLEEWVELMKYGETLPTAKGEA